MAETISAGQRKRISRLRRRASPEVRRAFENGLISARMADSLLYLPEAEQARQLAALLGERENRERRSALAAQAITSYLRERGQAPVDLLELAGCIRQALSSPV